MALTNKVLLSKITFNMTHNPNTPSSMMFEMIDALVD